MEVQQRWESGNLERSETANGKQERLANGLGWFSIGLGLAEIAAPGKVAELIGIRDEDRTRSLLRFYGMREIAAGVGILTQPQPAGWLWGRVAGDMLDLASLASAMSSDVSDKSRVAMATAAVLGVTALDVMCAQQLGQNGTLGERDRSQVSKTVIINRSPEEVYQNWRQFENFPKFMKHLEEVRMSDDRRSHWKAKAPAGRTVEWDAEITEDQPNSLIAWRSLEGSDVQNSGRVRFERAAGGRGTVVRVEMQYAPPAGVVGATIAKLFGEEPGQQLDEDLRRFKQIMEIGEIAKSDASIHSGMHAAQPPEKAPAM
jgi:uncharacterized membrane protein